MITRGHFQSWVEHPVTQWVQAALSAEAQHQKDTWIALSWDGGNADPMALHKARSVALAYGPLVDPSYESMCEMNEQTPSED